MPVKVIGGKISDTEAAFCRVDPSTHSLQFIDYEHHEIHGGNFYRVNFQKNVSNGGTAIIHIVTDDTTEYVHFRHEVDVEAEASIIMYEEPPSVGAGTAITPLNANRNSANASNTTVNSDPATYSVVGATILEELVLGSGKSSGGNSAAVHEWVLLRDGTYLIIVTNQTVTANEVNIRCSWYEHTDKD